MCFTPYISLATAMLEYIFATLILLYFRKSKVTPYVVALLYILGTYQFTELMLCATANANLWVRLGFVAYTFLPAVGVHFFLTMIGTKWKRGFLVLYALPVIFSGFAFVSKQFVEEGVCNTIFVTARTMFYSPDSNPKMAMLYGGYYYMFILSAIVFALFAHSKEENKWKRAYYMMAMVGLSVITLSPHIFIMLLPSYGISFPSIYCEFALLFAIIMFIASYLDHKYRIF
jgi:hypothetical protein